MSSGIPSMEYSFGIPMRIPLTDCPHASDHFGTSMFKDVESFASYPDIDSSKIAASFTVLAIGPAWSSELAKATVPQREQRPYVGLIPTVPVKLAGWRIEPPVSVAVAPRHISAATAEADPPDEPPGTRSSSLRHGLMTGP